jgi:hypothetical protein
MTLSELNAKIETLGVIDQETAIHLRDTRLGILGCFKGMEPTQAQVQIVYEELFGKPNHRKENHETIHGIL